MTYFYITTNSSRKYSKVSHFWNVWSSRESYSLRVLYGARQYSKAKQSEGTLNSVNSKITTGNLHWLVWQNSVKHNQYSHKSKKKKNFYFRERLNTRGDPVLSYTSFLHTFPNLPSASYNYICDNMMNCSYTEAAHIKMYASVALTPKIPYLLSTDAKTSEGTGPKAFSFWSIYSKEWQRQTPDTY